MILRRSGYVHLLDLAEGGVLAIHAVTQVRLAVTPQVAGLISWFDQPKLMEPELPVLAGRLNAEHATIRACVLMLLERGILTDQTAEAEREAVRAAVRGRDPIAQLDRYRRSRMEGSHPYWAVEAPRTLDGASGLRHRIDVLLLGDCDVQMETDFLRREAAARGIDLRAAASFAADIELARDRPHDAIIIGALQARHAIAIGDPEHHGGDPARVYVAAAETMLQKLRAITTAPILLDG